MRAIKMELLVRWDGDGLDSEGLDKLGSDFVAMIKGAIGETEANIAMNLSQGVALERREVGGQPVDEWVDRALAGECDCTVCVLFRKKMEQEPEDQRPLIRSDIIDGSMTVHEYLTGDDDEISRELMQEIRNFLGS